MALGALGRRRLRRGLDWGMGLGLMALRLRLRPVGPGPNDGELIASLGPALPTGWERWGVIQDWLLVGPDAGAWAEAAVARLQGQPLDPNRLPVYPTLTAWLAGEASLVVPAGHAVNHIVSALVPTLIWALGAAMGARAGGLVAAVLVALHPSLQSAAGLYGVDPSFQMMVVLTALTAWLTVERGLRLAPLLGLIAGLTLSTHYLGLAILAPLLIFATTSRQGPWQRWLIPLVAGGVAVAVFQRLFHNPTLSSDLAFVQGIYGTGVTGDLATPTSQAGVFEAAVLTVSEQLGPALVGSLKSMVEAIRFAGLPIWLLGALLVLGLLAPSRRPGRWDLRPALLLCLLLAPVLLLEAAAAPERYARYALPFGFLAIGRGIGVVASPVERVGRLMFRRWVPGTAALGLSLLFLFQVVPSLLSQRPRPERPLRAVQDQLVAGQLGEVFPSAGGLLTRSQNIGFLAGLPRCPDRPCEARQQAELAACMHAVLDGCRGEGDLPFVREQSAVSGPGDVRSELFERFVVETFPLAFSDATVERRVEIYRVDRAVLRGLAGPRPNAALAAPGLRPDGRPLPGPQFMGPGAALPPPGAPGPR